MATLTRTVNPPGTTLSLNGHSATITNDAAFPVTVDGTPLAASASRVLPPSQRAIVVSTDAAAQVTVGYTADPGPAPEEVVSTPSEAHVGTVSGYGFDEAATPTVTAGAYSAGDIVGGLMTFPVGRVAGGMIILQDVQVVTKSDVSPSLLLVVFSADPTSTTKTDNAAYSLNVADAFKVRAALPLTALGGINTDHGTPHTIRVGNLGIPIKLGAGSLNLYALLVDLTGTTLGSTSDVQVRLAGVGA